MGSRPIACKIEVVECISPTIFHYIVLYLELNIEIIKLQFNVPEVKAKRKDNAEIRSKVSSITPQACKRLGINKSTLWYMQKHVREGKSIKVYGKVMGKISE